MAVGSSKPAAVAQATTGCGCSGKYTGGAGPVHAQSRAAGMSVTGTSRLSTVSGGCWPLRADSHSAASGATCHREGSDAAEERCKLAPCWDGDFRTFASALLC